MTFFRRYLDRISSQSVLVILFLAITGARAQAEIVADGPQFWDTNGVDIFNRNPGSVGIGTLNPSTLLTVGAQDPTHQLFSVNRPASDIAALYVGNDDLLNAVIASNNADLRLGSDFGGAFTEHMVIQTNSGNVGIGTTDPAFKFVVEEDFGDDPVTLAEIRREEFGAGVGFGYEDGGLRLGYVRSLGTGALTLGTDGAPDAIFVANAAAIVGHVGIGTVNPDALMHIASATPGDQDLLILEHSPADEEQVYWGIDFRRHDDSRAFISAQRSGNSAGDLLFGTRPSVGGVPEERLRITSEGLVGIGTSTPSVELEVIGAICATGAIGVCSDARFKKDVEPMAGSLSRLLELRGVEFDWKQDEFPDHQFSDQRQIGFIAQEVLNVLPSVVAEGSDGSYSVDYGRLTPVLVEAIKELHQTVEDRDVLIAAQGQQIEDLMARLDRMDMMMARLSDVETPGAE